MRQHFHILSQVTHEISIRLHTLRVLMKSSISLKHTESFQCPYISTSGKNGTVPFPSSPFRHSCQY